MRQVTMDEGATQRLGDYFGRIGQVLGDEHRRASFAIYAMGLLGDAERKSVEPIAARACADPERVDALHQRLLHFTVESKWSDREVRRAAAAYALDALTEHEPVDAWIVDDTGFLKQGKHSVGVQRQYTGSAGKVTNCQVGISLTVATRSDQLPIDFELYLPECWANDAARRREARIPDGVTFQTKPQIALKMIRRAVEDGIPAGLVLGDMAYGSSSELRAGVRALGLHYGMAVNPATTLRRLDARGRPAKGDPVNAADLSRQLAAHGGFRRCTWRQGSNEALSARFAACPVVAAGVPAEQQEPLTLLVEWRDGEPEPAHYFLISLPGHWTRKQLVRLVSQRWRIERTYEDLKGELGLDHYEGRRFSGWHHHVSVALCCYAFVIAERSRRFPPSARRTRAPDPQHLSA